MRASGLWDALAPGPRHSGYDYLTPETGVAQVV